MRINRSEQTTSAVRRRGSHQFVMIPTRMITEPGLSALSVRAWAVLSLYATGGAEPPADEDLAPILGATPSALSRSMASLTQGGWIVRKRRSALDATIDTELIDDPQLGDGE